MRAIVVYESSYGNSHLIADAIAQGIATKFETTVVSVVTAERKLVETPNCSLWVDQPTCTA